MRKNSSFLLTAGVCILLALLWLFSSHLKSPPDGIEPMAAREIRPLSGVWHEVARIDNDIEAGAGQFVLVISSDGEEGLRAVLKDAQKKERWESTLMVDEDSESASYYAKCLGPLDCGFHIIDLDSKGMNWIVVSGHAHDQLWVFARETGIDPLQLDMIRSNNGDLGFEVHENWVVNNHPPIKVEVKGEARKPSFNAPAMDMINPPTPANEPPVPLQLPTVPSDIPPIPKNLPPIPTQMPR